MKKMAGTHPPKKTANPGVSPSSLPRHHWTNYLGMLYLDLTLPLWFPPSLTLFLDVIALPIAGQ